MTQPAFNIFDALSAWGKTLPTWQHFLLSKLVAEVSLPLEAIDEVYSEYLIDQDLADPAAIRAVWDMTLPQFQSAVPATVSKLKTISAVSGVNALATGETLQFGKHLTVIYGPNGAGKSGYARVLKSACFTRSKDVGILGNVKLAKNKQPKPTATFSFDDGSTVDFTHQEPCKKLRDGFAVFDSTCVRVHLDGRNAFQVMPYLFDVFPRMVNTFGDLQTRLRDQIARRTPAADRFSIQNSTSEVAITLATLTDQTDLTRLKALAEFGESEAVQLSQIEQKIAELQTTDPKDIVRKNEQRITDLGGVCKSIGELSIALQPTIVQGIADTTAQIASLLEQGAAVSAARFGSEPVQPVGTRAWLNLLSAAIAYGEEAYPGDTFPPQVESARCVLCQQSLDTDSADRLSKFYQTATSDVETQLTSARRALKAHGASLGKIGLSFFTEESAARRTVLELDADLAADIHRHIAGFREVIGVLSDAVANEKAPALSLLTLERVSDRVSALADRLKKDNDNLLQSDPNALISTLRLERQLLKDRQWLVGQYATVAQTVEDLRWIAKANACLRKLPSIQREVTSKQKALANELVAQGFISRFTDNCTSLRLTLPVQFKFAGEAGATDRKIELTNAGVTVDPSQVLSEGEQTAAALADFLTEVELNGACIGVAFDDPVTSMDHVRKEAIAQRLVAEAKQRQVIVFTHDILFTNYLATAAEKMGISFAGRTVWRDDADSPGVIDRLAFPHEHYEGAARDRAKGHYDAALTLAGDMQRDALEKSCGSLRTAYEDFIQKRLFNNVVRRWRENITFTLNQVYFDEAIALRIHERMAALSRHIDAHSHSEDFHEVPLTSELVRDELNLFDQIKSDYNKARKEWEKAKPRGESIFS